MFIPRSLQAKVMNSTQPVAVGQPIAGITVAGRQPAVNEWYRRSATFGTQRQFYTDQLRIPQLGRLGLCKPFSSRQVLARSEQTEWSQPGHVNEGDDIHGKLRD